MNRGRFVVMLACLLLVGGCASLGTGTGPDVKRMAKKARTVAYTAAALYLDDNPQELPRFQGVIAVLDTLIQSNNFDPIALHAALSALPIKELKGTKAAIIVGSAQIVWDEYEAEVIALDKAVYIGPVMSAIREGLSLAVEGRQAP